MNELQILWLRPSTGRHVSARRERIANHLSEMGVDVSLRDASGVKAFSAIGEALTGDYDVIIGNVRIGLYLGYPLARLRGVPFFGDVSDPLEDVSHLPAFFYKMISLYEWWVLDHADCCFFVESASYEEAKQREVDPILVRNSVDYKSFANPTERVVTKARNVLENYGVEMNSPIAMYIGSMVPDYYFDELVHAASLTPNWEFVFIGEERGVQIEELVSELDNAHYLGAFEYDLMPGFLSHATCGICLSNKEQPLKIMEYGAAGLPTIGYDGKLRKNFTDDELIFVRAEASEISESLQTIISNPKQAERYSENLQQRAKENSWYSVAQQYYEQIIKVSKK